MTTYPGLPGPTVSDFLSREQSRPRYSGGATFHIGRIEMVGNTGTYVDAPFHRFEQGRDIAGLPLERLADLPGRVFDATGAGRAIGPGLFAGARLDGFAVLIRTDWDGRWRTPGYGESHPFVTRAAAERLSSSGAALVGIDSVNIDDTEDGTRPAHTLLLEAGIVILEHLCNLASLPASGFRLHAVPAPVRGMGSFPVRAFAIIEEENDAVADDPHR